MPQGDRGGNLVTLCAPPCKDELHSFWDGALGSSGNPQAAIARAARLPPASPAAARVTDTAVWIDESFRLAQTAVYAPPIGPGRGPFAIDEHYAASARKHAEERVALAGARLAEIINRELVPPAWPR
jgi:hypothetical protein